MNSDTKYRIVKPAGNWYRHLCFHHHIHNPNMSLNRNRILCTNVPGKIKEYCPVCDLYTSYWKDKDLDKNESLVNQENVREIKPIERILLRVCKDFSNYPTAFETLEIGKVIFKQILEKIISKEFHPFHHVFRVNRTEISAANGTVYPNYSVHFDTDKFYDCLTEKDFEFNCGPIDMDALHELASHYLKRKKRRTIYDNFVPSKTD